MAARRHPLTVNCAHDGCEKQSRWTYSSYKEMVNSFEFRHYAKGKNWFCVRHNPRHTVLTPDFVVSHWISEPSNTSDGCAATDRFFGSSGLIYGPGFYADAKDFPVGTRIKVTAEVILPETHEPSFSVGDILSHGGDSVFHVLELVPEGILVRVIYNQPHDSSMFSITHAESLEKLHKIDNVPVGSGIVKPEWFP